MLGLESKGRALSIPGSPQLTSWAQPQPTTIPDKMIMKALLSPVSKYKFSSLAKSQQVYFEYSKAECTYSAAVKGKLQRAAANMFLFGLSYA